MLGLGNPGARYERTLHNAGYLAVERLRSSAPVPPRWAAREHRAECAVTIGPERILLARATTFMNRSGLAASLLLAGTGLTPDRLLVVADDAALPFGRIRIRAGGSAGGHKGLLSIAEALGTGDFPRIRLGIGAPPEGWNLADYVLEPCEGEDWAALQGLASQGAEAVADICAQGLSRAMNRWNPAPQEPGAAE